mmetsp:Transcript_6437/g.17202  ORF Transcript_6437/g.17202 Transcript_6437/m.17202 type:complete len:106 (+) Transcript_6437:288-605(+)
MAMGHDQHQHQPGRHEQAAGTGHDQHTALPALRTGGFCCARVQEVRMSSTGSMSEQQGPQLTDMLACWLQQGTHAAHSAVKQCCVRLVGALLQSIAKGSSATGAL